jgi:hypothetical protein
MTGYDRIHGCNIAASFGTLIWLQCISLSPRYKEIARTRKYVIPTNELLREQLRLMSSPVHLVPHAFSHERCFQDSVQRGEQCRSLTQPPGHSYMQLSNAHCTIELTAIWFYVRGPCQVFI